MARASGANGTATLSCLLLLYYFSAHLAIHSIIHGLFYDCSFVAFGLRAKCYVALHKGTHARASVYALRRLSTYLYELLPVAIRPFDVMGARGAFGED